MPSHSDIPPRIRNGVYGVLGAGIEHSLSPSIFRRVFAVLNWPAVYALYDLSPRRLGPFLRACADARLVGLNVTMPYKTRVIDHLDQLDQTAAAVGAVNTIAVRGHRLIGNNTDVAGVVGALRSHRAALRGHEALILGAGGAARAVAFALADIFRMRRITLVARTAARARRSLDRLAIREQGTELRVADWRPADIRAALEHAALLVNATPLGSGVYAHLSPLPAGAPIGSSTIVFDLIYSPYPTRLLRQAKRAGCARVLGGWPMLVAQADASFALWSGRQFPQTLRGQLLRDPEIISER
jgi:shikimate dehydrogenase